jgi:hypothetical protein
VIIHANALDVPLELFAECDVLIVDPPYSSRVHSNAVSVGTDGKRDVRKRDLKFGALTPELRECIATAARSVRRWSLVFSDVESIHEWRHAARGAEYIRTVPWIRWSQPQLSGDRPCTGAEAVTIHHAPAAGRKHWNGPGGLTHFSRRSLRGDDKHPTEKPLDLMLDLVSWFSDPGETVIDPCAGAGTTALACQLLGRECIAIELDELDEKWCDVARARLHTLGLRDLARAVEWVVTTHAEASAQPAPRGKHDVRTWERAQRRLADVARVAEACGCR